MVWEWNSASIEVSPVLKNGPKAPEVSVPVVYRSLQRGDFEEFAASALRLCQEMLSESIVDGKMTSSGIPTFLDTENRLHIRLVI